MLVDSTQLLHLSWNIGVRGPVATVKTRIEGTEPFRSRADSLPGTFAPWLFRSLPFSLPGLFAPWPSRSLELSLPGQFVPWPFRPQAFSLPGTKVLWNFRSVELSFPGTFAPLLYSSNWSIQLPIRGVRVYPYTRAWVGGIQYDDQ